MERKEVLKKLDNYRLTEFQRRVLIATLSIPKGETRSYKEIAIQSGYPNAARAVGSVMKMNPLAPAIPCHRVIKSSGETGSYSAKGGSRKKEQMLRSERAI